MPVRDLDSNPIYVGDNVFAHINDEDQVGVPVTVVGFDNLDVLYRRGETLGRCPAASCLGQSE